MSLTGEISASQQSHELIEGQTGVRNDATERADSDLLVVGNHNASIRLVASQNHVTAALAAEDESDAFQSGAHITA
jgi:hypothetical protein